MGFSRSGTAESTKAVKSRPAGVIRAFYEEVLGRQVEPDAAGPIEVADLCVTLTRVWDLGGTIVALPPGPSRPATAAIADPDGRVVELVEAEAATPAVRRTAGKL